MNAPHHPREQHTRRFSGNGLILKLVPYLRVVLAVFAMALLGACSENPTSAPFATSTPDPAPTTAELTQEATAPITPKEYSQPNIIFIMADDLGKNLLSLYDLDENVEINTPNLDRLAAEGVVFDNAYASPLCVVTRAELITGRYPFNNGLIGHIPDKLLNDSLFADPKYHGSFAEPLKQAGYATAMAGKWHLNELGNEKRILRVFGFDEWMLYDPDNEAPTSSSTHEGPVYLEDVFPPDALFGFVEDFITRNRDRPFFLYYPMHLVHRPLVATPLSPEAESDSEKLIAMTEYADHLVGRLMQTLEKLGLRDNTVLFFSGDNGTAVSYLGGEEMQIAAGGKGSLLEAGVNVPFIVSGGPVAARGRTDALTDFTDVLPTLAEFAGAPVPEEYRADGHSIVPFLTGWAEDTPRQWIASAAAVWPISSANVGHFPVPPNLFIWDRVAWHRQTLGIVIRDRRFKMWHYLLGQVALFDLQNDPQERVNLWGSNDPEIMAAREKLAALRWNREPIPLRSNWPLLDPIGPYHGMFSHWRFDHRYDVAGEPHFPDSTGGYDARISRSASPGTQGKFGDAMRASTLPPEAEHFGHFFEYASKHNYRDKYQVLFGRDAPLRYLQEASFRSFTLSVWVRLIGDLTGDWHLLSHPQLQDGGAPLLDFTITKERELALRLAAGGPEERLAIPLPLPLLDEWMHIAATWDADAGGGACGEATLYINGLQRGVSSCLGNSLAALPGDSLTIGELEGGQGAQSGASVALLDDVAVWRQALTPAHVAALHTLGNEFGYDATQVNTLFNTPAIYPSEVGSRQWTRTDLSPMAQAGELLITGTPEGAMEIHFGDSIAVRSEPPAVR